MSQKDLNEIFTSDKLLNIFPADRSDQFFDALFGDSSEGAYDISLHFSGNPTPDILNFELHLAQRPGKCLACNLTYGLPDVFSRHPIINLSGTAKEIARTIGKDPEGVEWSLASTISKSSQLHIIPFNIKV